MPLTHPGQVSCSLGLLGLPGSPSTKNRKKSFSLLLLTLSALLPTIPHDMFSIDAQGLVSLAAWLLMSFTPSAGLLDLLRLLSPTISLKHPSLTDYFFISETLKPFQT